MPAPKFAPVSPKITVIPPVIYSQPFEPQPSTTTEAPEFRTQNLSPARPFANNFPAVAPYKTVFPIIVLSDGISGLASGGRTTILPPDNPFPT